MDIPSSSNSVIKAPLTAPTLSRSSSSKLNSLYEISYIPDNQKIQESVPPILNPYSAFNRSSSSFSRSIKTLIKKPRNPIREYVQTSSFDQCQIPATSSEQYITLEIPQLLIEEWKHQAYTHIHFGAIRLALSYHGRKGLPVIARLALLDTRYPKFQHACIATVQATLNAGTIVFTTFPNFNISLQDRFCSDALKVQIQLSGAEQNVGAVAATLHYQMVWRLQDHAIDLAVPSITDALMLTIDTENATCCKYIPRQISHDDLVQLLPQSWVTCYEKTYKVDKPILSDDATMQANNDGTTTIQFSTPRKSMDLPNCFQKQFMISPIYSDKAKRVSSVCSFSHSGKPIHYFKDPESGHCYFDNCDCDFCVEADLDEHFGTITKKSITKSAKATKDSFAPLGQPSGKFDYLVKYTAQKDPNLPVIPSWDPSPPPPKPPTCMMFTLSSTTDFPEILETVNQKPKIIPPQQIQPDGSETALSQAEAVLNWQSENAKIQTHALQRIEKKIDSIRTDADGNIDVIQLLKARIEQVHHELMHLTQTTTGFSSLFRQKEAEMKDLQIQLSALKGSQSKFNTSSVSLFPDHWNQPPSFFPLSSQPFLEDIAEKTKLAFGNSSALYNQLKNEQVLKDDADKKRKEKQPRASPFAPKHPDQLMVSTNPISSFLKQVATTQIPAVSPPEESDSTDDSSDVSTSSLSCLSSPELQVLPAPHIFMNTAGPSTSTDPHVDDPPSDEETLDPQNPQSSRSHSNFSKLHTFSIDDIPCNQWRQRFTEFQAWIHAEMLKPNAQLRDVLKLFTARLVGTLKEWWLNTGAYRQLQFLQLTDPDQVIYVLFEEFLGPPTGFETKAREEFFAMKCCSFKRSDLDKHYKSMSQRYYLIKGMDDPNVKQAFLASFPESLGFEAVRILQGQGKKLETTSIGQIFQSVLLALDKLCAQNEFFDDYMKRTKHLAKVCSRPELKIKCKDEKRCSCTTKKKVHSRTYRQRDPDQRFSKQKFRSRRPMFLRRKAFRKNTSGRCYLCGEKGHFAKQCHKNRKQSQKMVRQLQQIIGETFSDDEVESIFSIDDEPHPASLLKIKCCVNPHDSADGGSSDTDDSYQFAITSEPSVSSIYPMPLAPMKIFQTKYSKPIQIIAFIDTGAACTILNPDVLPPDHWNSCTQTFQTANGDTFTIDLISKPIVIQPFPGCSITHKVYGSRLPDKDMVLGFDVYSKFAKLRILPDGIRFKQHFLPWTDTPKIFALSQIQPTASIDLFKDACAESHSEFLTVNSNPLWKNSEYFIRLPFKLNEDINPTKASHSGMSPEHQELALKECRDLLQQGLIEESSSQWACEAFYVNKRSEQNRGKLRLVINYQPLNSFLQDNKFPLPSRNTMFSNICGAKLFSKFDLKAGFWQLGIHPDDRHKTGFCIPNHHYQWTVMPFGLKTAPSIFQKAMVNIFTPILHSALIYIDDILLYSSDEASHLSLLQQFAEIVKKNGIMLSEKKIQLSTPEIEFLGMKIANGRYQAQPHISEDIHSFPDVLTSKKQIQQFLGLVNYVKSFIPHLSKWISPLTKMLSNDSIHHQWSQTQTDAVKKIKEITVSLPSLKIPSDGRRILQTDASDEFWAAILFEEDKLTHQRHLCGYQSGKFKDSQAHYHSTFKEILAVKHGIEKFEIHLIGHYFVVESDMKSFTQMLSFKPKKIPHQQLLRWEEWFSKYNFSVQHIKGSENFLADYLSRKKKFASILDYPSPPYNYNYKTKRGCPNPAISIYPGHIVLPQFFMMITFSTSDIDNPPEFRIIPNLYTLNSKVKPVMFKYLQLSISKHEDLAPMIGVHPIYHFSMVFTFVLRPNPPRILFPQPLLWFFWCFLHLHFIAFEIPIHILHQELQWLQTHGYWKSYLVNFLTWFQPLSKWQDCCSQQMNISTERWITVILNRTVRFQPNGTSYFQNNYEEFDQSAFQKYSQDFAPDLRRIQKVLFEKNQIIPPELWPSLSDDAPWDMFPTNPDPAQNQASNPDPAKNQASSSNSFGPAQFEPHPDPFLDDRIDAFWAKHAVRSSTYTEQYYNPPSPRSYKPEDP